MEQEREPTPIDGYMLVKKISGIVLATTTFTGAVYIGYTQADQFVMKIIIGLFAGFVAYASIDLLLGAVMGDLIRREKHPLSKWLFMIALLILTGGTTFVFGLFVSEDISEVKTTDEKQDLRTKAIELHTSQIIDNQKAVDAMKKEISRITYTFKKDTALMIAGMRENHRNLYRKGAHTKYMKRSNYYQLKESVNRIEDRISDYKGLIKSKRSVLNSLESGISSMRVSNPLETLNSEIEQEEARKQRMGDIVKGMIWIFDVASVLSLFFSFIFVKSILKNDGSIPVPVNEFSGFILYRWTNLAKKVIESADGTDQQLSNVLKSFLGLFWSVVGVFAFFARFVSWILSFHQKLTIPGQSLYTQVTTSSPSSPSSSPTVRTIGYHRPSEAGEKPVNKLSEKLVKNPAKLGATRLSSGEDPSSEQVVHDPVNKSVNKSSEQVVNVQVVNGEPTFHHYSTKTGEAKEYTRNEVRRFESKYRTEISTIKDWITKNQDTADLEKVLRKKQQLKDKLRKHSYWKGGLDAIDRLKEKS